jgi:hypothetical protein
MKQSMNPGYFRLSTAGDASTDMLLAKSRSAFGPAPKATTTAPNYRFVLTLAVIGLIAAGMVAVLMVTEPVLLAWTNPM